MSTSDAFPDCACGDDSFCFSTFPRASTAKSQQMLVLYVQVNRLWVKSVFVNFTWNHPCNGQKRILAFWRKRELYKLI